MEQLKRQRDDLKVTYIAIVLFWVWGYISIVDFLYNVYIWTQAHEAKLEQTVQGGAKDLEQLMNSRTVHLAKQDECMKKIRDLGSLPADAFETYVSIFLKLLNCPTQLHNTFFFQGFISCCNIPQINKAVLQ